MTKSLVVLGAGGHARVLVDILLRQKKPLVGLVSLEIAPLEGIFSGIPRYQNDDDVLAFDLTCTSLINGIGSLPGDSLRSAIYDRFTALGYHFEVVVSPSAIISSYAELDQGVQVMPGAVIQAGARIGANTIINTGAIIDHDCTIGEHNHIAPGVVISGGVRTASYVHVGTGATIVQCIVVGESAIVGAGAVITKDLSANHIAYGSRPVTALREA